MHHWISYLVLGMLMGQFAIKVGVENVEAEPQEKIDKKEIV